MTLRLPSLRARLDVDERREQLLRLGLDLFGARNYDDISIDDIAAAAGISRSLLYHYFRNKRGFYVEIIRHTAAQLHQRIQPDQRLPPRMRLRAGLVAYLDYVAGFARAYATLLRSGVGFDAEVSTIVEGTRNAIVADIVSGLESLPADTAMLRVALRGWLGMVEFASLEWLERREVPRDALIDMLIDALEVVLARAGVTDGNGF